MRRLPGSHEPNNRNRSSKHLGWLTRQKSPYRSMSNEALAAMNCDAAIKERTRRAEKAKKKAAKGK